MGKKALATPCDDARSRAVADLRSRTPSDGEQLLADVAALLHGAIVQVRTTAAGELTLVYAAPNAAAHLGVPAELRDTPSAILEAIVGRRRFRQVESSEFEASSS